MNLPDNDETLLDGARYITVNIQLDERLDEDAPTDYRQYPYDGPITAKALLAETKRILKTKHAYAHADGLQVRVYNYDLMNEEWVEDECAHQNYSYTAKEYAEAAAYVKGLILEMAR